MKKYIVNAIIGMGFGFPITILCMCLFGGFQAVHFELLVWMVACALSGRLATIMDDSKQELPLPLSFGIHFFGCVAITLSAAAVCGYLSRFVDVLLILAPTIVIYIAVCGICFLLMKKNEKEINKALEEK